MKKEWFILGLIVLLGFLLRIYDIGKLPASLNPDEVALGYNAYSLLKTGADEHGRFLPLSLESFGDWKLPVYSYLDTIPIALFDATNLSVRLPSVIFGTFSIILIYLLVFQIFKNTTISLFSSLFLAFNPWSIFFSRGAYEVNVATTIFLCALYLFILFIHNKKTMYLISAFVFFGITMFTQHNYIVFSPLLVFVLLFLYREKFIWNRQLVASIAFFVLLVLGSYLSLNQGGNKKASNLSIVNNENVIYNRAEKLRGDGTNKNLFIEKVFYNKYSAALSQFSFNYLSAFSSDLLFDKGGERLTHNIGGVGYFYLFDAFLFIFGIASLLWKKEKRALLLVMPWLLLAPIPSAITTEHTGTRMFTLLPPFIIIVSYGAFTIVKYLQKSKVKTLLLIALTILYGINISYFLEYYFVHFNMQRIRFWRYGYKEIVKVSNEHKDYNIVMRGPENFPYIYFLFYNKYDPKVFQNEVTYYPRTKEGFLYVKHFGRYTFVNDIDKGTLVPKVLYITDNLSSHTVDGIRLPNGDPWIDYFTVNK